MRLWHFLGGFLRPSVQRYREGTVSRYVGTGGLAIPVDDLPKYSEAFPFLSPSWVPGTTPTIINVSKVSGEVAELVAKLYRSLKKQHPERERDVVQFSLQCVDDRANPEKFDRHELRWKRERPSQKESDAHARVTRLCASFWMA